MRNIMKTLAIVATGMLPATAFAEDKVTLNWALWDWSATVYYQPLIEAYEASHPNVKIEYTDLGSQDYSMMVMTQLTGGADDLDIITIKDIPGYANMVNSGSLLDLTKPAADAGIDTAAYSGVVEALSIDGGFYALPFRSDFWITYYNKDLFDAAGVEYPSADFTLEEWADKARKLTSGMGANKVYGSNLHTWRSTVQLPGLLDGKQTLIDGNYEFLAPHYERALALQNDGAIQSYSSLKASGTHYSGPFYNGSVAMLPMGSWFIGTQIAKVKSGESLSKNWGIATYPHPKGLPAGTTAATITSVGINANSAHKEAALDFIKFVTGSEGASVLAKSGTLPALRDDAVIETIASKDGFPTDANSRAALTTAAAYLEMAVSTKAADIELVLNRAHDSIMTENISVADGIKEMNEGVKAVLDGK